MKKPTYEELKNENKALRVLYSFFMILSILGTIGGILFENIIINEKYPNCKAGYNQCISDYKNGNIPESTWYATDDGNSNKTNATGYGAFELVNETPQWIAGIETTPSNEDILVIIFQDDEKMSFSQNGTIVYKGKTLMNNREVSNAFIDLTLNREQYCDKFKENSK